MKGYNVVNRKEDLIKGIPTMVIGWEFTKEQYPDADIIDWRLDGNTYWTFGNREKRSAYESRMEQFKRIAIDEFVKSVRYEFFNVITRPKEDKESLMALLKDSCVKKIYINSGMVYIYIPFNGTVYGISLRDIDYMGKSAKVFLSKICKSNNAEVITAKRDDESFYNMFSLFKNAAYIIPCMYYEEA